MRWEVLDEKTTTEFLKVRVEIMRRVHRLFSLLAVIVALQIQDYNLFNDFVETVCSNFFTVYLSKFVDSFENSFLILDCFSLIF
jgi:uncharacterized protein (DUF488 family)